MQRKSWDRIAFAAKLPSIEKAPEPLRSAILAVLKPHDIIGWLTFGPTQKLVGSVSPASLLAVLEHEWIVATGADNAAPEVYRCDFANTLLVELVTILLYGRLRLDFVQNGRIVSVAVHFNTVVEELYKEAVQILLEGIAEICPEIDDDNGKTLRSLKAIPLKFQNGIIKYLPIGEPVLGYVHWSVVLNRKLKIFWREIVPEGVLVLTSRQLIFISEEKVTWRSRTKYGYVVTYFPLSRIAAIRLSAYNSFDAIDIDVCADQIGEKLKIDFPCEKKAAMAAFTELVTSSPGFSRSRGSGGNGVKAIDSQHQPTKYA